MPALSLPEDFGQRILDFAEELARYSEDKDALSCTYLTPAHVACAGHIESSMRAIGLDVRRDAVGNVIGRLESAVHDAPTLITGSHYDTVRNGGKFDGRLGIIIPMLVAGEIRRTGALLPFHLEIVAFAEEEGARFSTSFLASGAYVGAAQPELESRFDAAGESLADALADAGSSLAALPGAARGFKDVCGYVEIHIEQGPVLLDRELPLGIVTSIAGSGRFEVSLRGTASHAGTTPMNMRRDAAAAASEMVLAIESRCAAEASLVGTVGQLEVPRGSVNVIAGRCRFTMDIRASTDPVRDRAIADVEAALRAIAFRRGVDIDIERTMLVPAAPCAPRLIQAVTEAVRENGVAPFELVSGAGHDAMSLAKVTNVGMLFVRCGNGGISHNPRETVSATDAGLAARTFLTLLAKARFLEPHH